MLNAQGFRFVYEFGFPPSPKMRPLYGSFYYTPDKKELERNDEISREWKLIISRLEVMSHSLLQKEFPSPYPPSFNLLVKSKENINKLSNNLNFKISYCKSPFKFDYSLCCLEF